MKEEKECVNQKRMLIFIIKILLKEITEIQIYNHYIGSVMPSYISLHNHNEFSLLDGIGTAEDYVSKAKKLNFQAIGMTNHGNVDGLIKFQNACKAEEIIPIHGCELYIVPNLSVKEKGEKRKHITVWVKNNIGWENLLKMLTISNAEGFYYKPRIDPELLLNHLNGLVIATACTSSFITEIWGKKLLKDINQNIPNDFYMEVMPFNYKNQIEINKLASFWNKKLKIKLLASNDCHFPSKGDEMAQEVLLAIQTKKKWKDKDRWKFEVTDLYLKTESEMQKGFEKQNILNEEKIKVALSNTVEVFEKCKNFRIEKKQVILPRITVNGKKIKNNNTFFIDLCEHNFKIKILNFPEKSEKKEIYRKRLNKELEIIIRQEFVQYFLVVWELINWCKSNDIMVGPGRGSSGGSLVCYLLGITSVDPIQFNLIFARFISPARIDLPDIDIDFEDIKRSLIREHLENLYGKYNVAGTSTFLTMKGRGALRDVSRVFDVSLVDVNKASSCIVVRSGGDFRSDFTIEDAFATFEDGRYFKKKYPEVVKIAMKFEGQVRGKGQHAAAIIVSEDDLRKGKRACLVRGKGKDLIVNWDKYDIEHVGLMKLDILGLNALTVLNEARKLVKKNTGKKIDFEFISITDDRIFKEFSKGNTVGCFQFGSLGLRKLCIEMGIENFDMLTHANALYRPGTLRSGMVTEFIQRKNEGKKFEFKHPILKELTNSTYGIILYQEQVMRMMYELSGLGWRTADIVRKVISKSQGVDQFNKFREEFAEGCVKKKTLDKKTAIEIWNTLSSFGSYSFNLSHAVEYAMIAYWDMYCKIYHPVEFICASLTHGSENKKEDMIEEAIRLGIDVRSPKVGISKSHSWIIISDVLYCPFIEIKGFGDKTAELAEQITGRRFFDKPERGELTQRFKNILQEIKSNEDFKINPEFAESIAKYFKFSFNRDPYKKFNNMIKKLSDSLIFSKIKEIDFTKIEKKNRFYFGKMTEIRFGYRGKIDTVEKKLGISGTVDNLGGVYGNFKDKEDFCMLVFDGNIYNKKKYAIEHSGDKFLLARANRPNRTTSILCNDAWMEEDLMAGNFDGLDIDLIQQKRFSNKELLKCRACDLINGCKAPVLPSRGKYNIMIVGEAPWTDEDEKGESFVGKTGTQILWPELRKYNLNRKMFNITNVVKCKVKSPKIKYINACSTWLDEEIEKISPSLILAFGNTSVKYFTEVESGIMNKCGETEWNEKAKSWICWCIHPTSVLYSSENRELFQKGIRNFVRKVEIFGEI